MGTKFSDPIESDIVWEVNPGSIFDDDTVQAELIAGPEDRLGEMSLFWRSTIEANLLPLPEGD
jgi:hypothetical protein